jgi:hypothetical protein
MYPCRALLSECFFYACTATIQAHEGTEDLIERETIDLEINLIGVARGGRRCARLRRAGAGERVESSGAGRGTAKQRKVLEFCDETPRTAQEILEMLGVQNQNKTRQQYTTKLVLCRTSSFPQGISLR